MAKPDPSSSKKEKMKNMKWVITIFLVTIVVSGTISMGSDALMSVSGIAVAFLILFLMILVGILFDVIGVAVTSADEKPFHSMAARKVPGAQEAIALLRKADRVGSICNDVVGDICGVVSGSASATIATLVIVNSQSAYPQAVSLLMSALVAGLTVGGKALGKGFAINCCTAIVHTVGRVIYGLKRFPRLLCKKK